MAAKKHRAPPVAITEIVVSAQAREALAAIPEKFRLQIAHRIDALVLNPHPPGSKKLHGEYGPFRETAYRERSGDYRIIYTIRGRAVVVLRVDNRKDVYR